MQVTKEQERVKRAMLLPVMAYMLLLRLYGSESKPEEGFTLYHRKRRFCECGKQNLTVRKPNGAKSLIKTRRQRACYAVTRHISVTTKIITKIMKRTKRSCLYGLLRGFQLFQGCRCRARLGCGSQLTSKPQPSPGKPACRSGTGAASPFENRRPWRGRCPRTSGDCDLRAETRSFAPVPLAGARL
jgi:hypothetical protein